jgi:hypothetical protein
MKVSIKTFHAQPVIAFLAYNEQEMTQHRGDLVKLYIKLFGANPITTPSRKNRYSNHVEWGMNIKSLTEAQLSELLIALEARYPKWWYLASARKAKAVLPRTQVYYPAETKKGVSL